MKNDSSQPAGMSLIVKTVARWLVPCIIVFGIYVIITGHISPGGGFAGGVVIACALMLLALAEGKQHVDRILRPQAGMRLAGIGALLFLGLGVVGMIRGGAFLENFLMDSQGTASFPAGGGIIVFCEFAIAIVVSMALYLVFAALSCVHVPPAARRESARGDAVGRRKAGRGDGR